MDPTNQNQNPGQLDKCNKKCNPDIAELMGKRNWMRRFLGLHDSDNYEWCEKKLEKFKWEIEQHLSLFKGYSDLAIKSVGIFAAVVGGILSISFTVGGNADVKRLLLQAAFIMSLIMCGIFFFCGFLWFRVSNEANWIGRQIKMIKFPGIIYLSYLLWLFAILFLWAAYELYGLEDKVP